VFSGFSSFDYGWGTLANAVSQFTVGTFDLAIPGLDTPPEPHDLFISTDLLERVEPELVDVVIDDLERLTNKKPFHQVGTYSNQRQASVLRTTEALAFSLILDLQAVPPALPPGA